MEISGYYVTIVVLCSLASVSTVDAACNQTQFSSCTQNFDTRIQDPAVCTYIQTVISCVNSSDCQDSDLINSTYPAERIQILSDCSKGLTKPPATPFAPPSCNAALFANCTKGFTDFVATLTGNITSTQLNTSCSKLAVVSDCVHNTAHCYYADYPTWTIVTERLAQFVCNNSAEFLQSQSCFLSKAYRASIASNCTSINKTAVNCSLYNNLLVCEKNLLTQYCDAAAAQIFVGIQSFYLKSFVQTASTLKSATNATKNCVIVDPTLGTVNTTTGATTTTISTSRQSSTSQVSSTIGSSSTSTTILSNPSTITTTTTPSSGSNSATGIGSGSASSSGSSGSSGSGSSSSVSSGSGSGISTTNSLLGLVSTGTSSSSPSSLSSTSSVSSGSVSSADNISTAPSDTGTTSALLVVVVPLAACAGLLLLAACVANFAASSATVIVPSAGVLTSPALLMPILSQRPPSIPRLWTGRAVRYKPRYQKMGYDI